MRHIGLSVLLATLVSACAPALKKPSAPLLAGEASTSGGAANYMLSLDLPDGQRAFKPSMNLQYSSRSGNSSMGVGWSLPTSAVFRCPATLAVEGHSTLVQYREDDALCMDGLKLVLIEGEHGKDGSIYSPEVEQDFVVSLKGNLGDPDTEFLSVDDRGQAILYSERVTPAGANAPLTWLISAIASPQGNLIRYEYEQVGYGEVLLRGIRYDGALVDGKEVPGEQVVLFQYEPRTDAASSFLAGGETRQTALLKSVAVGTLKSPTELAVLREYTLTYRASVATGRPLLARIESCIPREGKQVCARPIANDWSDQPLAFNPPRRLKAAIAGKLVADPWLVGQPAPVLTRFEIPGDLDADGRREIVARSSDSRFTLLHLDIDAEAAVTQPMPSGLSEGGLNWPALNPAGLSHYGSANIMGEATGKLAVALHSGASPMSATVTSVPWSSDLLAASTGGAQVDVLSGRNADGFYELTLFRNGGLPDKEIRFERGNIVTRIQSQELLHLSELPGITDRSSTAILSGNRLRYVADFSRAANGTVLTTLRSAKELGLEIADPLFADVNGDGLVDAIGSSPAGTWTIQMNRGDRLDSLVDTGIRDVRSPVGRSSTIVADVDSDGRQELIFPNRRIVDYCIQSPVSGPTCSEQLGMIEPRMDMGIYSFDGVAFRLDRLGKIVPTAIRDMHLVGQANRMTFDDLHGDGSIDFISPFDRGVANGRFRDVDGRLDDCPPAYGCGPRISSLSRIKRQDRRNAEMDVMVNIASADNTTAWNYYPLSNPVRRLYDVPALTSSDRYIDANHFYFTSSMYVVGEQRTDVSNGSYELRFNYGGGIYNREGRGFVGFKWIVEHDVSNREKTVGWFLQEFPYVGNLSRSWSERESDDENDYLHGNPGKEFIKLRKTEWSCRGPAGHAASRKFNCEPHTLATFKTTGRDPERP